MSWVQICVFQYAVIVPVGPVFIFSCTYFLSHKFHYQSMCFIKIIRFGEKVICTCNDFQFRIFDYFCECLTLFYRNIFIFITMYNKNGNSDFCCFFIGLYFFCIFKEGIIQFLFFSGGVNVINETFFLPFIDRIMGNIGSNFT